MGTAITVIIILLVIVGIIALVAVSGYNGFVKSRNQIQESWRQIDVELNRRYELIPNLVETVRAYAAHERNTLEDITRLRSQAQQLASQEGSMPSPERADVEAALSGAVRNLIVSVEAYPDLKSNQNFLELQRQLTETEDRIAAGRRFYNANVRVYNTKIESVPTNIIANAFKFEKATYFEVNEPAVRSAPDVSFGEIAYRGDPQQASPSTPQQSQLPPTHSSGAAPTRSRIRRPTSTPVRPAGPGAAAGVLPRTRLRPRAVTPLRRPVRPAASGGRSWPRPAAAADPARATAARPAVGRRVGGHDIRAARHLRSDRLGGGLGCNNFGARMADEDVAPVVNAAIDAGVTLFDTADVYGNRGRSEILLGRALGSRRQEVMLATKFGADMGGLNGPDWGARGSRRYIRIAVEASLRRLGTDWIDLYQLHSPDPNTPIEETLAALSELVAEGKVRYIGSSNLTGWQVVDADWTARTGGYEAFISAQNEYSWLQPERRGGVDPGGRAHGPESAAVLPPGPWAAHRQVPPGRAGAGRQSAGRPARPPRSGGLRHRRGPGRLRSRAGPRSGDGGHRRPGGDADRWLGDRRRDLGRAGAEQRGRRALVADRRGTPRVAGDDGAGLIRRFDQTV